MKDSTSAACGEVTLPNKNLAINFDPVGVTIRTEGEEFVQVLQKEQKQTWVATLDNDLTILQNNVNFEIKTSKDKQQFNVIDATAFTLGDLFHSSTQNLKEIASRHSQIYSLYWWG